MDQLGLARPGSDRFGCSALPKESVFVLIRASFNTVEMLPFLLRMLNDPFPFRPNLQFGSRYAENERERRPVVTVAA